MEFTIATLVAIISLGLAYLAHKSQQNESFKRLHYTSFIAALLLPRSGEIVKSIAVHQDGYELTSPFLCVARIENTGRAPILPSDFNGPLTIRLRGVVIFRCGELTWNRPDILDPRRSDNVTVDDAKGEISISPILLNPHDSITVAYVAEAAPEKGELEVTGRIAGVEEIIRLPMPAKESTTFDLTGKPLIPVFDPPIYSSDQEGLSIHVLVSPILASPGRMFTDRLTVFVDGNAVPNAHMISVVILNSSLLPIAHDAKAVFTLRLPQTKVIKLDSVIFHDDLRNEQGLSTRTDDVGYDIQLNDQSISICPPNLGPQHSFVAAFTVSGDCANLTVEPERTSLRDAQIMRLTTGNIIEANLARAEPRLLLTNQTLYRFWHSLRRYYPWLKHALSEVRAFLGFE